MPGLAARDFVAEASRQLERLEPGRGWRLTRRPRRASRTGLACASGQHSDLIALSKSSDDRAAELTPDTQPALHSKVRSTPFS